MAQKSKKFEFVKFPPEVIQKALGTFDKILKKKRIKSEISSRVSCENECIWLDNEEEFYLEYQKSIRSTTFKSTAYRGDEHYLFELSYLSGDTEVRISLPQRDDIDAIMKVFESPYKRLKKEQQAETTELNWITKTKEYKLVKFPPEIIKKAFDVFLQYCEERGYSYPSDHRFIYYPDESWSFGNEIEFWAEYREGKDMEKAVLRYTRSSMQFDLTYENNNTKVQMDFPSKGKIVEVFEIFDENYERYRLPEEDARKAIQKRVKIFIGHGRSQQWRDLKDHLQDKHHFNVIAYETGTRAGLTITKVLEKMSEEASFALLVHTAEDEDKEGGLHARENVIHETGLFQGKLGFERAIVLREEECEDFSNMHGVQELRFSKGNIKEIFGDVLATIYREFGVKEEEE